MNFFKRNRIENWIVKLFKITDSQSAEQFDMESCILSSIYSINQNTGLTATDFDLNYKDSLNTLKGFKKALKNQNEIVYSFVRFESDKTNTYFSISNPMLNYMEQPLNSALKICIQVSSEFANQKTIERIAEELTKTFDFEYGYVTKLPANYDSETERKIKKGLFSTSVEVNNTDLAWTFHLVGIQNGYIKSLYPLNYLNKSHFNDSNFKERILKYGTFENISDKVFKWSLNSDELDDLKKDKQIKSISIITDNLEFLQTDKAKSFNDKMNTKKASC